MIMRAHLLLYMLVGCSISLVDSFTPVQHCSRVAGFSLSANADTITVAVTREDGKNSKLMEKLALDDGLKDFVDILELPCIEHAGGKDYELLGTSLAEETWDYIVVTSPEASKVLASAWNMLGDNQCEVIAVGKATEKSLEDFGIPVSFVPSKATAETLVAELESKREGTTVLYPASTRARQTLQRGLEERGFSVKRLNTYDTVTASWSDQQKEEAKRVDIACFASVSSIKGWLYNTDNNQRVAAACIGETSANACREQSWSNEQIYFPEAPGIDGWIDAIKTAVQDIQFAKK